MQKQWQIKQGGQTFGPYGLEQIHDLISTNNIPKDALFGTGDQWVDVDTFKQNWPDSREAARPEPPPVFPHDPALGVAAPSSEEPMASFTPGDSPPIAHIPDDTAPVIERDAILVLGRRRAGKTIFLATLYSMLWKAIGGLTMKALSGQSHSILMAVVDQLKRGEWPEATLGSRQLEFELTHKRRQRLLIALDYSGEDFRRAFVEEDTDSPEVKKLLKYVDRAAAVILLVDPAVVAGGKQDEINDDDFGMVQAVERIRNWHGGSDVPVVIALTKADRNKQLIRSHGDAKEFVLRNYPALARTLGRVAIFEVCAVQERSARDGRTLPRNDSIPIRIDHPLRYCLRVLRDREHEQEKEAKRAAAEAARNEQMRLEDEAYARSNRRFWIFVTGLIVVGLCGCAVLYMVLINQR